MKRSRKLSIVMLLMILATVLVCAVACTVNDTYTITYQTNANGVSIPPLTAIAGSKIYPPANPEMEGYRFEGWELNGQAFTFDVMPEANITLVAKWSKLYTVTFVTSTDATQIPVAFYAEGETVSQPETPKRSGYMFTEWQLNGETFVFGAMPASDVVLVANWVEACTISFNTGTSEFSVEPIVAVAGTEISAPVVNRPNYYLKNWLLNGSVYEFTVMPDHDVTLTAEWMPLSNLPALMIDLTDSSGNVVPLSSVNRDDYVKSTVTLANTEDEYLLNSVAASFKGRGNGSWEEAKKGYRIKFDKKQSVFGRAANKNWVIIACANFDDVTMSRNYLAYNMANEVFSYIEYTTQANWVDVYVNGEYRGVYLLCEHVRVDSGRVDIESEYGVNDTGYLIEYDAYYANEGGQEGIDYFKVPGLKYAFTVHSPDPEDYMDEGISKARYQQQVAFIKDYVTRVYSAALNGDFATFAELADVDSFVDMYILHELFKNTDTGFSSFYLYKKPNGKLYAGPAWDFDATTTATRGDASPQGIFVAGSVQNTSEHTASELYIALYQNANFKQAVIKRWKELSPKISTFLDEKLNDEVYAENKTAMGKNFALWKGKSQTVAENDWVNDVKTLKTWLQNRIAWLNSEWK